MKKIFSFILVLVLLFPLTTGALAADISSNIDADKITLKECYIAGSKWLNAYYNDETEIESIIPINNLYDELNGYCINFSKNGTPNGYLILNATKYSTSYIREFSLNGTGIYNQLLKSSGLGKNVAAALYTTNPFEYALKYTDAEGEKIYNCDATIMPIDVARKHYIMNDVTYAEQADSIRSGKDKETYYNAFFNGNEFPSGYLDENDHVIPGADSFIPYTMTELRNATGGTNTENCGPTAAANICALYYSKGKTNILTNGNIYDTYNALVSEVSFDPTGETGTVYMLLKSGLRSYVRDRSYSISVNGYLLNQWSGFKEDFDDNMCNLIFVRGTKQTSAGEWITVGHFVVGIGYRILNDGSRYIRVYDGWYNSNNRFLNFDADSLVTFKGASVSIS